MGTAQVVTCGMQIFCILHFRRPRPSGVVRFLLFFRRPFVCLLARECSLLLFVLSVGCFQLRTSFQRIHIIFLQQFSLDVNSARIRFRARTDRGQQI